jgi:tripartite-type tricarboxylate transporter receptor subunit TctC
MSRYSDASMLKRVRVYGLTGTIATLAIVFAFVGSASADDFFKGKTVRVMISSDPGGGYDAYARFLAQHIGRHIPGNPNVVAQNMGGAGGMTLLNHAYNVAPQDGTVIFTLHQNLPMYQRMGERGVQYDARRIQGIGRLSAGNEVMLADPRTGIKSYKDLYERELVVAATGATSNSAVLATLARNILGLKVKVISGYKGTNDMKLALERGEVQGIGSFALATMYGAAPEYLKPGAIVPLIQFGANREKEWPDAPVAQELAKSEEDRKAFEIVSVGPEMGRSYWVGPGVPKDRVQILRTSFNNMIKDEKAMQDFKRLNMLPGFATGEQMDGFIKLLFDAPEASVKRLSAAMRAE